MPWAKGPALWLLLGAGTRTVGNRYLEEGREERMLLRGDTIIAATLPLDGLGTV